MSFLTDLRTRVDALCALLGDEVVAGRLPETVSAMTDAAVIALIEETSALIRTAESLRLVSTGVVAARSTRTAGRSGLAQTRGHRSPVSLIQEITGATRTEATKQVRIGEGLTSDLDGGTDGAGNGDTGDGDAGDDVLSPVAFPGIWQEAEPDATTGLVEPPLAPTAPRAWHAPLDDAILAGFLTAAQHDAIRRGLGEPPLPTGEAPGDGAPGDDTARIGGGGSTRADTTEAARHVAEAWSLAAEELLAEAAGCTVEDLARTARLIRDRLDPEGAARRFDERFRARSFRLWTDADGVHRASIGFDDEMAAWVRTIIDTALRPRRGGPRFVDSGEHARAERLRADERTNDQLAYDLIMDTLSAGALADAESVFGARQPGIRVVISHDDLNAAHHGAAGTGATEDSPQPLPAWLVAQRTCEVGVRPVSVDGAGNPLFLGRTQRLFTPAQRVALAVRDGGCRWPGCDRPASYCESHHIDPWHSGGRTDIDRGILLCRFHHMNLHHHRWRITRSEIDGFVLHPPPGMGDPVALKPRLALRYAWGDHAPPPRRFLPAA